MLFQLCKFLKRGTVAVHRIYTFDYYEQSVEISFATVDEPLQMFYVVMPETLESRSGQPQAVDYAGMYQFVGQHQRTTVGKCLNYTYVGVIARVEQQRRTSVKFRQGTFQSLVGTLPRT